MHVCVWMLQSKLVVAIFMVFWLVLTMFGADGVLRLDIKLGSGNASCQDLGTPFVHERPHKDTNMNVCVCVRVFVRVCV